VFKKWHGNPWGRLGDALGVLLASTSLFCLEESAS
jgi:hypothetical protein